MCAPCVSLPSSPSTPAAESGTEFAAEFSAEFSAADARSVLAVQAFEATADSLVWTAEDRQWATRLARDSGAAAQPAASALSARARHALQRLLPRQPALATLLQMGERPASWVLLLPIVAFIAGVAVDAIGGSQRINLLAPPVWAVVLWNLAVYGVLAWPAAAVPHGVRGVGVRGVRGVRGVGGVHALLARWAAPAARWASSNSPAGNTPALQSFAAAWARVAAPATLARAALLLHMAAAALALGMLAGLYLRGLVMDYRAGWQSTFLDPAAVRGVLAVLMAPATWLTGIVVPDAAGVAALRVGPDAAATANAAPWLHLYAATLLLAVLVPRTLLALAAAWRLRRFARRVPLPLHEPYFQRLLRDLQGRAAVVQVLPHGAAPAPQATLGLRDWLAAACGDGLQLRMAPATAYGQEDDTAALRPDAGTTLRVLLADLGSTPEDDSHGRLIGLLAAQQPGLPLLVLTDEAAFRQRFAQLPARLAERRAAWQAFARAHGAGWVGVDLQQPDLAGAQELLQAALHGITVARPRSA